MDRNSSSLTLVTQPQDYFRELVSSAISNQKISVEQPEVEFYLVDLMSRFMLSEQLREGPLALMIKDALEHPEGEGQRMKFRQVGDVSLYVAGYFQDSLNRKLVDVDYYIDMGGTAYLAVAARAEEKLHRAMFEELAAKFGRFVEVLAEVSDRTQLRKTEKDLLRLYEVWVRTRSERAARALQEAGIVPNDTLKKSWQ